jgi:hypothetical protein
MAHSAPGTNLRLSEPACWLAGGCGRSRHMNGTRILFVISAALAVGAACGSSVNPAGDDAGGDDGGGFIPTGDGGSSGTSSGGGSGSSGGGGTCASTCNANRVCVDSCGAPQAGSVWCCSSASACYQAVGSACPTSSDAGRGGGGGSGMACMNSASCGGGMRCCAGLMGATCQSSCPGGIEACQKNSDCSGGMCITLMGPGFCLGGGPPFDASTRG